jgi:hypothetical protein
MHCLSGYALNPCGGGKKTKKIGEEKILLGWEKKILS